MPPQISLFYSIWAIITSRSHTRNNVRLHRGKLNSLREENGIADTARHGPIWHAIDAFFNVRANRETPSGWVLAVLLCCWLRPTAALPPWLLQSVFWM